MSGPTRIWLCAAFHPAFRCGGWAHVRLADDRPLSGGAGGERHTTGPRTALAGLAAALRELPAGPVEIRSDNAELIAFAGLLARLGQPADASSPTPEDDLDLWARIISATAGRQLSLLRAAVDPATPIGFATAWAELARDKAKATGPFTAAIPKANLAKVAGLER